MQYSEEDIKQKFVMPYLGRIGFDDNELTFEKSFRIKLPRRSYLVDTAAEIGSAQARLDILVTHNGKNLFVVEVKTDSAELTEDDRDQAITYCRLLHQLAPVAIVTNGRDTKIYNAIDKSEIPQWDKGRILAYDPKVDLQAIYQEALEHFVGYSIENVRIFCRGQVDATMKPLLGSREEPHKKYVPEVYVASKQLTRAVAEFLQSDKSVFALIGDSGSGKTCAMCGLAKAYLETHPVLFYRARNLTKDLICSVADDFNWEFSAQTNAIALFKKLTRLFGNRQVLIFVDAVDEWENSQRVELLGEIARHLVGRNIKVILSCRTELWPRFLSAAGIPSDFSEYVFASDGTRPGYKLTNFDQSEFIDLLNRYRMFYGFTGTIENEVLKECRQSPFLLRIVFEVARQLNSARLTLSARQVYDQYYQGVLERIPDLQRDIARRIILALAKLQLQRNEDISGESDIRQALSLSITEDIPQSLFEASILERSHSGPDAYIGFYFRKLRDYLIAFQVESWDRRETVAFRKVWEEKFWFGVKLQASLLFYQIADEGKKAAMDFPHRDLATKYLALYESILERHFSGIRVRFLPHTSDRIGLVGVLDLSARRIVAFGFIPIKPEEQPVRFVPTLGHIWGKQESDLPFMYGVRILRSCSWSDWGNDQLLVETVLEDEIVTTLKELVRGGMLDESRCKYLPLERAIGLVAVLQKNLHGIEDTRALSQYLPISFDKIELGLQYARAWRQFQHQMIQKKASQRTVHADGSVSYSVQLTQEDRDELHSQAKVAAMNQDMPTTVVRDFTSEQAEQLLEDALVALKRRSAAIEELILPDWDNTTGNLRYVWDFWKEETLATWIPRLYESFLSDYKAIVEVNFSTLKEHFELYSLMPVQYFVAVDRGTSPLGIETYLCSGDEGGANQVTVCEMSDLKDAADGGLVNWKGRQYTIHSSHSTSLASIMCPPDYYPFRFPAEHAILRHQVYSQILRELPIAVSKLRSMVLSHT